MANQKKHDSQEHHISPLMTLTPAVTGLTILHQHHGTEMIDLSGFDNGKHGLLKHVCSQLQMGLAMERRAKGQ